MVFAAEYFEKIIMSHFRFLYVLFLCLNPCYSDDENCIWSYKCCEFKRDPNDGSVRCEKMCDPEIKCETTTLDEVENFNTSTAELSQAFILGRRRMPIPMCRKGYKFVNGSCRRVFKKIENVVNEN